MISRTSRLGTAKAAALFGTASFMVMAGASAAQAQLVAQAPIEEILITGSLISGATPIGIPVTALGEEAFMETGAISISDVLIQIPEVEVLTSQTNTGSGGNAQRLQEVTIRGIATGAGTETLLMINGMRVPIQGFSAELIDPSIIAPIAIDRVEVLAEGASAVYGSDAVAGVINVILRRNFDGALTQVSYSQSTDLGADKWVTGMLYGTSWDTGQVTVSASWTIQQELIGKARDYWTLNFEPFGFEDRRTISTANPAVVTEGRRRTLLDRDLGFSSSRGTRNCSNCFSLNEGLGWNFGDQAPGPTTDWATIQSRPGVLNLHDPSEFFNPLPKEEQVHLHYTFDQTIADDVVGLFDFLDIFSDVNLFAEGFYSNRGAAYLSLPGASPGRENLQANLEVSTSNPYYPTGAPDGVRINYNLAFEHPSQTIAKDITYRYAGGLQAALPQEFDSRFYYSKTYVKNLLRTNGMVNENHFSAALGNTIDAAGAGEGSFTKPDGVPFFNPFCDAQVFQCNSPVTLDYISGFRNYYQHFDVTEWGAQLNGPLFELPGGPIEMAVLGNYISHSYYREDHQNYNQHTTKVFAFSRESFGYNVYALTGQVQVPLIGPDNTLRFTEAFVIEGGYRFDRYSNVGDIWTPKISARWDVAYGLSLRGTWGNAFRAPGVAEASATSSQIQPRNTPGAPEVLEVDCEEVASLGLAAGTANPGSLDAVLNPTCSTDVALVQPPGITVAGGAGVADPVRGGFALDPEDAVSWSVGGTYAPLEGPLTGLTVDTTYWKLRINGILDSKDSEFDGTNDPRLTICTLPAANCNYLLRSDLSLPITDPTNAVFLTAVKEILANPRNTILPSEVDSILFIEDNAITNVGFRELSGVDFNSRYDFAVGNLGVFNVGWRGAYALTDLDPGGSAFDGNTGGQFTWRARLGWAGDSGFSNGFTTTLFLNHIPHSGPNRERPPECYWAAGFSAGSCYAGSPYSPQPGGNFSTAYPGLYVWDLNLGYTTGLMPSNTYLQGLNFNLNIRNLLNKAPPFNYEVSGGRGEAFWDGSISPLQRYITFTITKRW